NNESDSPYNLYLVPGLPPTPIGAPGRASLEAAAAPSTTPFFFYVLISEDGSHAFAETFEEHQANIEQARSLGVLP
ncbi:MAG TPA: endolytic transglycosylase MltG, partial [Acidimicrobiia bacterium]|nr:endolytic transglycosylase MltG [Acidimicrobiia bacterium]